MNEQILLTLSLDEFKVLITGLVNDCLDKTHQPDHSPTEIIDRVELCKRLAITTPTAIRWGKKGKIPNFRIGSNVRYNWGNVINVLEGKKEAA